LSGGTQAGERDKGGEECGEKGASGCGHDEPCWSMRIGTSQRA
jgi:hypothetical protein